MKKFVLFIFVVLINFSLIPGEVRYVSHSGSNTPPYLTWETAADSIMSAVNISSFGDTIYVANGVYEERVVMIPGLSLIGAGMDSTVISFPGLSGAVVTLVDSCTLKGFQVSASDTIASTAVDVVGNGSLIESNSIMNTGRGVWIHDADTKVYGNVLKDIYTAGIDLTNSNSLIRKNFLYVGSHTIGGNIGIHAQVWDYNDSTVIDSNIIYTDRNFAIWKDSRSKALIKNNLIFAFPAFGILLINCDSVMVYNNLIYAGEEGISSQGGDYTRIYNNYIYGPVSKGITSGSSDTLKNNVITDAAVGIYLFGGATPAVKYNEFWRTDAFYSGFTGDSTNLNLDPMVVNDDPLMGDLDFHLQKYSPLIDAGDPAVHDKDGSRSDIGLYGGPYGELYTYLDLAPRPPHNITASIEDSLVKLTWNANTEADLSHYRIYRDTVSNFIYDSTKIVGETGDTVFYNHWPSFSGEKNFYYLITAFDNQGNQSQPGEEVSVFVTGLKDHQPAAIENYRLLSNYPNPFNPSTIIPYRLKEAGYVKLYVYDIKGELVRVLVNQHQAKGYHAVVFRPDQHERSKASGLNIPVGPSNSQIASGVYLYMIMVTNDRNTLVFSDIGKMILLK